MSKPGTIIVTFDEDGEVLAWVITPLVDPALLVHSNGDDDDRIRTYATAVEDSADAADIEDALDLLAQVHAIDARNRRQA